MYIVKRHCGQCFQPERRRLALLNGKDHYECYAEGYVKCFWGLCDHQESEHGFANKTDGKVITEQPIHQQLPFRAPGIIQSILVTN